MENQNNTNQSKETRTVLFQWYLYKVFNKNGFFCIANLGNSPPSLAHQGFSILINHYIWFLQALKFQNAGPEVTQSKRKTVYCLRNTKFFRPISITKKPICLSGSRDSGLTDGWARVFGLYDQAPPGGPGLGQQLHVLVVRGCGNRGCSGNWKLIAIKRVM